jgi:hypothetical protein
MIGTDIGSHPIHLGRRATAEIEPLFTGSMDWYDAYVRRHGDDGTEGRLVSMYTFAESWDAWEMHPHGNEAVLCTAGALTLLQERADGTSVTVSLGPGQVRDQRAGHLAHGRCRRSGHGGLHNRGVGHEASPSLLNASGTFRSPFVKSSWSNFSF